MFCSIMESNPGFFKIYVSFHSRIIPFHKWCRYVLTYISWCRDQTCTDLMLRHTLQSASLHDAHGLCIVLCISCSSSMTEINIELFFWILYSHAFNTTSKVAGLVHEKLGSESRYTKIDALNTVLKELADLF